MSGNQQLITALIQRDIPAASILAEEKGSIYGFRVELGDRTSWLYLDRVFFDDHSPVVITNLFNIYKVTDALQDTRKPQKLYFDGTQLVEYVQ